MILVAIPEPLRSRILTPALMDELRALGPVTVAPTPDDLLADDTRGLLADTEVLLTGWGSDLVDAGVLAAAPRLRAVVHSAGSVRPVVTRDVYARGVLVSSQAWANALPVAEYAVAMVLLSAKGVHRMQGRYRAAQRPPGHAR